MDNSFALTGNPNVGKTSLFNRITHSFEHVGNWHGVTVTEKSKEILYNHKKINITDLPGLYSMSVYSYEESVARDSILDGKNDIVVSICEVNNLPRNLYLTLQMLELDLPVVIVVNMVDELKKQGKVLNYRKLEEITKVPVIPMSAKYHSDVHLLMDIALEYSAKFKTNKIKLDYLDKLPINDVLSIIGGNVNAAGLKPKYAAIKVLENDRFVIDKLELSEVQKKALETFGDWQARVAAARYEYIDKITEGVVHKAVTDEHHEMSEHVRHNVPIEKDQEIIEESEYDRHIRHHNEHKQKNKLYMQNVSKIDKIVLNKYLALPIFLLLMALIFLITFGLLGKWMSDGLEWLISRFINEPLGNWFEKISVPPWADGLIREGIIDGVGGILVFLPQIVLLFFFLALLEDSGYISRVAFMTDGLFRKIGLSGRSVFTMLMGFGCSATAVLTARGLEDPNMRRKTVILTPFMSCSARLPVYTAICAAYFTASQPFIIFGLYILGAVVAIALAAIFEKIKGLKSGKMSFIMEMPPYRFPTLERVWQIIWNNVKVFLIRVGTVIFALTVIIWLLSNFSFKGYVDNTADSLLGVVCKFIAPIFGPLGFGSTEAVISLMSGLVAKEAVISTMSSLGGVEVIFGASAFSAFCFLVFTLLYVPCIATLSAISKELGFKWALINFVLQMGVAYIVTLVIFQTGRLFQYSTGIGVAVVASVLVAGALAAAITYIVKRKGRCIGCSGGECDSAKCGGKKGGRK